MLVITIFAATAVWLAFVAVCRHLLRTRHPSQFEALGRPSFQGGAVVPLILFVAKRGHNKLGDIWLSVVCDIMLVALLVQVAVIIAIVLGFGDSPSLFSSN
jgi:hypothetical protein